MDTLLDKDGNEIYNATGYSARLKENGKLGLNRATGKLKKTFRNFEDAVEWAKKMNQNPKFIHK